MEHVKDIAEYINILAGFGYRTSANESAAMHALNNASLHRGQMRELIVEEALTELVAAKAVFDVSGAYRVCLDVIDTVDDVARYGVELSLKAAFDIVTGTDST